MECVFDNNSLIDREQLITNIENFENRGELFVKGKRNTIKLFTVNNTVVNVKSFKVPNLLNQVIYGSFRKSKARRSFEYAQLLRKNNIGTPRPIAYFENFKGIGLKDSYYACEHLLPDLTFRELVTQPDYPDHENILRQFTRFSFMLHEKGIEFKDHSPGNTLIKKAGGGMYNFFLVDLNRMNFHDSMDFNLRMENLKRLTPKEEMVAVMSDEYARLYHKSKQEVHALLWEKTAEFQRKFHRKRALKRKFGLKKK